MHTVQPRSRRRVRLPNLATYRSSTGVFQWQHLPYGLALAHRQARLPRRFKSFPLPSEIVEMNGARPHGTALAGNEGYDDMIRTEGRPPPRNGPAPERTNDTVSNGDFEHFVVSGPVSHLPNLGIKPRGEWRVPEDLVECAH